MPKKLVLDCDEATWDEVLKFKIDAGLNTTNEAVISLIKKGLKK